MAVITPRNGASLAQVVQTALNIAGREAVFIETGGTTSGVRVPDEHQAAIEEALGWPDTYTPPAPEPTPPPEHPTTPPPTQDAVGAGGAGSPDPTTADPAAESGEDGTDATAAEESEPVKAAPPKKTNRRARRDSKEG
jgi:hypothetical protein